MGFSSVKYCNDSFFVGILMSKNLFSFYILFQLSQLLCLSGNIPYKSDDAGDSISEVEICYLFLILGPY